MYKNRKVSILLVLIGIVLTCLFGVNGFESYVLLIGGSFFLMASAVIGYMSSIPYTHCFEIDDWKEERGKGFTLHVPFKKHRKNHPAIDIYEKTGESYEKVGVDDNYTYKKDAVIISTKRFSGKVIIK